MFSSCQRVAFIITRPYSFHIDGVVVVISLIVIIIPYIQLDIFSEQRVQYQMVLVLQSV